MQPIINRIIANNFADFDGLNLTGTLAISEALLNAVITNFLKPAEAAPLVDETPNPISAISFQQIINNFQIEQAQVELQAGKIYLHLKVNK